MSEMFQNPRVLANKKSHRQLNAREGIKIGRFFFDLLPILFPGNITIWPFLVNCLNGMGNK
jgi:hypothetical protein